MPRKTITSLSNPNIKTLVKLRDKKDRQKLGLTLVEGRKEITVALKAGVVFKEIYFCPQYLEDTTLFKELASIKSPQFEVTPQVFAKISFGDRKEGILGVCEIPKPNVSGWKVSSQPLFVVLESVEKPGNLGAILRTADAAGVEGILVCDPSTDIYNPNVIRSSLGTVFTNKVAALPPEEIYAFLKKHNAVICASVVGAKTLYTQVDFKKAAAIVMGAEDKGLGSFWLNKAQEKITIPMRGQNDSLNVSVAAAILIYEALRQKDSP